MIIATLFTLLLSLPIQVTPPATGQATRQGKISGRVVAADSGKPIAGAAVRAVSFEVMRVAKTVLTSDDGRFEFAGLLPGRYQLDAAADFYIAVQFGDVPQPTNSGRPIDLTANQHFDTANFAMPRSAAVGGVLLDEFGDPAPNILVQLARLEFAAGRRRLLPIGAARVPTDDRGQFRIYNLAAGDYYVVALAGAFSEQNEAGGFAPTYFPGTADVGAAKPVHVDAGRDQTVTMTMAPAPTVRIAGRLADQNGQPMTSTSVMLVPADHAGTMTFTMARGVSMPNGTFAFRNVPPGKYTIQAFAPPRPGGPGNLGAAPFGFRMIDVNGLDIADADVTIRAGAVVRGRFVFDGDPDQIAPNDVSVGSLPVNFDSSPAGGGPPIYKTNPDWTFDVYPIHGIRFLRANSRIPRWTVKRISIQGKDVTDEPIDFRNGDVSDVEVLLTTKNPTLEGTVQDAAGAKLTTYSVIVFASEPQKWAYPSRFVQMARPNQSGQYRISGLPPENYLAIAVPDVSGTEWQDPARLEKWRAFATPLTLTEGEARTLALRVVR